MYQNAFACGGDFAPRYNQKMAAALPVLGIETSCDETACALVFADGRVADSRVFSQAASHARFGGVVPEIASRDHLRRLLPMIDSMLRDSDCLPRARKIPAAIAYTAGPGLAPALLAGGALANALACGWRLPAVAVNHLEAHILSPFLRFADSDSDSDFVAADEAGEYLALLASGGHTQLWHARAAGDYRLLGETRDDAAGEALDKTALLLGLDYPGGPAIEKAAVGGDENAIDFPRAKLDSPFEFSFSGLKTAAKIRARKEPPTTPARLADFAASLQSAVFDMLVAALVAAIRSVGARRVAVVGGVARNGVLRQKIAAAARRENATLLAVDPAFCADNAAMIAFAAARRIAAAPAAPRPTADYGFEIFPRGNPG